MTASPDLPVKEGDVLAGKYRVERVLGVGGMGVVVAAMHVDLDERVALKFLLEEALGDAEAVERFAREARAAVRIKTEHVARVIDVGKLESGAPYMVMEYLEGHDLAAELEKRGHLPALEAVDYVLQACEAIAEAHALGIVHRDLKPANLFLAERADGSPIIKVLDFGISKATQRGSRPEMSLTKTTAVMGSPYYMSPEQMRSAKDADARSDIWALGVILHELLSGRVAFEADTIPELCMRIVSDDVAPMSKPGNEIPSGLELVVRKCLEKLPAQRYPSIADLATALVTFAPKRSRLSVERIQGVLEKAGLTAVSIRRPSISDRAPAVSDEGSPAKTSLSESAVPGRTLASWGKGGDASAKTSRLGALIGAGIGVVLVGAIGLFFLRGHGSSASDGTPTVGASTAPVSTGSSQSTDTAPAPTQAIVVQPAAPLASDPTATATSVASALPPPKAPLAKGGVKLSPPPPRPAKPAGPAPASGLFDDPK